MKYTFGLESPFGPEAEWEGGRTRRLSPRYQEIAPIVISAYTEQRSIRDIMKAFSIPSTTTTYKKCSSLGL